MITVKIILFFLLMLVVPYLAGASLVQKQRERGTWWTLLERWNFGNLLMYALFEIVALIGTFAVKTLNRVTAAYFLALLLICMAGLINRLRRKKKQERPAERTERTKQKFAVRPIEAVLFCIVAGLIVYQMIYVCLYLHMDEDDAYYVGTAVTSYYTNTLSVYHPYTGQAVSLSRMANYVLSPYPIYWAMWGKLLGLHPTILMHTILPAVQVMWCYVVYLLLSELLCDSLRSRLEFMLFVVLLQLFGGYSGYTAATYLFCRGWQGKSVLAAVLLPLLWYLWMRIRKEPKNRFLWCYLAVAVWAACLCSTMAMFLGTILLAAFGLEYLIEKRKLLPVLKLAVCALPFALLAGVEVYLLYFA